MERMEKSERIERRSLYSIIMIFPFNRLNPLNPFHPSYCLKRASDVQDLGIYNLTMYPYRMSTFLVSGSIAYDMLLSYDGSFAEGIDTDNLENLSVAYVTRHLAKHYGGTAANIAWNFKLLNQDVMVAGSVGKDGDEYIDRLKGKDINVSCITQKHEHVTPTAIIGTDSNERQITFFHPGADLETEPPALEAIKDKLSYVLVSPHSTTSMMQTVSLCQEHEIPYVFDPGQQILQFSRDDLRRMVDGSNSVIVNSYEWTMLCDSLEWTQSDVLEHAGFIVVTHGEHGVGIQTQDESIVVEAVPTKKLVNPTGAGDAFRAGFVTGLSKGWDIKEAGRLGATIASFVVECEGTQLEEFLLDDLYERAEKTYGQKLSSLS